MERQLTVSYHFLKIYMNASEQPPHCYPSELSDKQKFNHFIANYLAHGFGDTDLFPGRMKESTDVDKNDPKFIAKVQYARKHHLWHYHIGIPCYEATEECSRGDWLSAYLLNFQKFSESKIKLVDFNSHPPFTFPSETELDGDEELVPREKPHLRVVK
ncbi:MULTISPECIES: hypothetical protein [Pseudidiomarina]|uniref:Uncharacterized protein n=1 Tax=Pseudidiomarina homiensis TaxID=364198 RepID=A0A432Y5Z4_9GAMM|nr:MULTISPECIES: hypothetical protein [Pseudidiomarina]RUO56256.1 hypothetical protein CWI70_05760 [Pseudidiomarina homiensis]